MKKQSGFTLIELLAVIFIIAILTGIGLVSFLGAQKQARDTTRRSDLGQYRNALENYAANNNGLYIEKQSVSNASQLCTDSINIQEYITECPVDVKYTPAVGEIPANWYYRYVSNADKTAYLLYAQQETGGWWYICSNGRNGKDSNVEPPTLSGVCGT